MSLEKAPTPRICKIERIEGIGGNEVAFSPERGGIITSLKLAGTEVLYMDDSTFRDPSKNVRGGIPLLFPQAGPADETAFPGLKSHGLARLSHDWVIDSAPSTQPGSFAESLTMLLPPPSYPYMFRTRVTGTFDESGTFELTQSATNLELDKRMPIAMGLHPYFKVPAAERQNIVFDFPGGEQAKQNAEIWMNDGTVSLDNPGVPMRLIVPTLGTLVLTASPEYKKVWIWSKPDSDFICIEPVMRDEGGIVNDPRLIAPSDTISASLSVSLER